SGPSRKNILVFFLPKSLLHPPHPASTRGAFRDRHGRWVRDAVDADSALTKALICGRQSRVVLTPRRWRQVLEKQASWGRRWQTSPVAGESTQEAVKTIARGMLGVAGVT